MLEGKKIWTYNYKTGTKYELYPVILKKSHYAGLRFKDIVMILYHKRNIFMIAIEVRVAGQYKVFVNPAEYIFENCDHRGYVIHSQQPTWSDINGIYLNRTKACNFFIMDYLN